MKHFVTLAALLTSLSAFAQLPYNPDANNDGHIGAFDLTSLLSVYSGNFSNGVLGEGTEMAEFSIDDNGNWAHFLGNYAANSYVVDLSLVPSDFQGSINFEILGAVNGTTVAILRPSDWVYSNFVLVSGNTPDDEFFIGWLNMGSFGPKCIKMVFWNGEWLSLYPGVNYLGF